MSAIHFVDTTVRDGSLSLWATGMRTKWALTAAPHLDAAGFLAAEIVDPAHPKKMTRELKEDFFERVRLMATAMPRTPLRIIINRQLAFDLIPDSLMQLYVERLGAAGAREARISDPSNTPSHWGRVAGYVRNLGLDPILNLIFSISPKHTDEYYATKARAAAALQPMRICLKDPGALLTPERVRTLVPIVLANIGTVPLEIHTHCMTGQGLRSYLEAITLGVRIVNTAVPPLADGSSNPSVFSVARNARILGYTPNINEEALIPVRDHFEFIARREGLPMGTPQEYDQFHYMHQVPGGMISNLQHQLKQVGMGDRVHDVLLETARVREELGYPIMVTPYSQFVGIQAALNIITGERYSQVTDQVIQYAIGHWGEEERDGVQPAVRDRILSSARSRELAKWEPPQGSVNDLRKQYGGPGVSDDEVLLRYFAGVADVQAMRAAGPVADHLDGRHSLGALISYLLQTRSFQEIRIRKGELLLHLTR